MKKQACALFAALMLLGACSSQVRASWPLHMIDGNFSNPCDVVARDFDGDGDPDVAGLSTNGTVNWYENDGYQAFNRHLVAQNISSSRRLEAGDLDGDGDLDLIVASYPAPGGLYRLMNNGAMQFTVVQILSQYEFYDFDVKDMDEDGDLDIVGTHTVSFGARLTWWENTENGQVFVEHRLLGSSDIGYGFGAADMDLDGDIDLVSSADGSILWLENNGNRIFTTHTVGTGFLSSDVNAGDLDGDGDMDVLASHNDILWYHNDGNQNFSQVSEIPSPLYMHEIQVMDVDGDGCMDISGFSEAWGYVRWVENFLCRGFYDWIISYSSSSTVNYDTCDFNGDGRVDFAATGTVTAGNIQWYENTLNPTVKLLVAPVNTPIVIPPQGGEFSFDVWIWNTSSDTLQTDFWTGLYDGDYGIPLIVPIILDSAITLAPDIPVIRQLVQRVPAALSPGYYLYKAMVGDFPNGIVDHGEFYFSKTGISDGSTPESGSMEDWGLGEHSATSSLPETPHLTVYPNPFNPTTVLSFELRDPSFVKLAIFDISGRLVTTLADGWRAAGSHQVTFDGADLPSGIYIYCITVRSWSSSEKMILLK